MLCGRRVLVLFGSQTGTSGCEAIQLSRLLESLGIDVRCVSLGSFSFPDIVDEDCILFLLSTTGEGDPPATAKPFYASLMRQHPADVLDGLDYAVFGFGDSSYSKYNVVARAVDVRLSQLGGRRLLPLALGDESSPAGHGPDFALWVGRLVGKEDGEAELSKLMTSRAVVTLEEEGEAHADDIFGEVVHRGGTISNTLLTESGHFQRIYSLEIERREDQTTPSPGDLCLVYYTNPREAVKTLMGYLPSESHQQYVRVDGSPRMARPACLSLNDWLQRYLDICTPPSFYFVKALAPLSPSGLLRDRLLELTREDYNEYVCREKRRLWEVLHDFAITTLPLETLLEHTPLISPRAYSLCNADGKTLRLLYAVVEHTTPSKR